MTDLDRKMRKPDWDSISDVWIEDAIGIAVSRLHELGRRAMDQHVVQNQKPTGTVPKPGPSFPLSALASRLRERGFGDGIDKWEWEHIDLVWNWVEDKEDLQHPLAVFVPILMMKALRHRFEADFSELTEDLNEILRNMESAWNERFSASELARELRSIVSEE